MADLVALEDFLKILPPAEMDRLAIRYDVDAHNQVRLPGRTVLVCLLNGVLNHPELSQRLLEETYTRITGRRADHSSFGKRLASINPAFVEAVFGRLYDRLKPEQTAARTGPVARLRFVDATTVSLSAKLLHFGLVRSNGKLAKQGVQRRHVKAVFALSDGGLPACLRLCRDQAECSDCPALGAALSDHTAGGDLWVFDKGMNDRERLEALHQADAFFLTPHNRQSLRRRRLLYEANATTVPEGEPPAGEEGFRLVQVEEMVFENAADARSPKRQARWEQMPLVVLFGYRYDPKGKAWKPMTLLTNLPVSEDGTRAGPYTFDEVVRLYRRRWEIETFFKFLKEHLGYEHLVSRSQNGIQVMILVMMIAALLMIWYRRESQIDRGWKAVKYWLSESLRLWTQKSLEHAFLPP